MGIRERHDRERSATTQAILDAARELFTAEGYRNVSMRKIAERIEYSPAAIYSYFPSKDAIYLALAEDGFRRLHDRASSVPDHPSALARLRQLWWVFYEFSREHPSYFELMFVDRSVPQLCQGWSGFAWLASLMETATTEIQRAIDAGELPPSVRPRAAVSLLWGTMLGPAVIQLGQRLSPGEDSDLLARDILDTTLAGLAAGAPSSFIPCEIPVTVATATEPSAPHPSHA
jgi:AcrR family transcriptional regulator